MSKPPSVLVDIFDNGSLSPDDLSTIVNSFQKVEFKKNDFLLREGQVSKEYFFIESGFIRAFAINTDGEEISTGFYTRHDIVLDLPSFFLKITTQENIQTLTDCVCWSIQFNQFQTLFHSIEAFREGGRTRLVNAYFELKQRSISMIADSAKDRYLKLLKSHPEIVQHVPLKYIATYLGITDTSLSRIRKDLLSDNN